VAALDSGSRYSKGLSSKSVSLSQITLTIPKMQRCSELVFEVPEQPRDCKATSCRCESGVCLDESTSIAQRVSEDPEKRPLLRYPEQSAFPPREVIGALQSPFRPQLVWPN
jgi:hypothetical protein